jgi:thiamine-monophosphate kinase
MAAKPEAAVASVTLPRAGGERIGKQLLEGMLSIAAAHGVTLAGGDTTSWNGPLVVSVAMLGSVSPGRAWRRDGARVGDFLVVTGGLGGSLRGRHLSVTPRCQEALVIAGTVDVHAAIDVSDGLSLDLSRMTRASGCGAELELARIPVHPDAVVASEEQPDGGSPLERALGDGEDFELLMSMSPSDAERLVAAAAAGRLPGWPGTPLTIIGRVVAGPGLVGITPDGCRQTLAARGYLHAFD